MTSPSSSKAPSSVGPISTAPGGSSLSVSLAFGAFTGTLVMSLFVAYAYLAETTFRASAVVAVEFPAGRDSSLQPLEAARRLHDAALDRELLQQLAQQRADTADPEARARVARDIRAAFDIETVDGRSFTVSYRDSAANRAQTFCNSLAERVVGSAARVFRLDATPEERAREDARRKRADELIAFLARHPELTAEPASPSAARGSGVDPVLLALRSERAQIEARLASTPNDASGLENPYSDPAAVDPEVPRLRRRLQEVVWAIGKRREALERQAPTPAPSAASQELKAEWQRLLAAVAESNSTVAQPVTTTVAARLVTPASLPKAPIEPNRPFLLWVGALIATGASVLAAVGRSSLRARSDSRPLTPSESAPRSTSERMTASRRSGGGEDADPFGLTTEAPVSAAPSQHAAPESSVSVEGRTEREDPTAPASQSVERASSAGATPRPSRSDLERTQRSSSAPPARAPIVEVNAEVPEAVVPPEPLQPFRPEVIFAKLPAGRVTQMLGSPLPAEMLEQARPSAAPFQTTTQRSVTPPSATGYSYVSAEPSTSTRPQAGSNPPLETETAAVAPTPSDPAASPELGPESIWDAPPPADAETSGRFSSPASERANSHVQIVPEPAPESPRPVSGPAVRHSAVPLGRVATPAPGSRENVVARVPAPPGWRADGSLSPQARSSLCNDLYPLAVEQCFVLVVSGVRGTAEATARVAAELALALAETRHPRILLLEGNLQRPSIHRLMRLEMPMFGGFSEQLDARVHGAERKPWTVLECGPSLDVLAEGVMRLPELILSRQFEECVRELRNYYDVIVIDGPQTSEVAACRAVQDVVDGAVLVCSDSGSPELAEASALFSQKRFSHVLATGS